MTSCRRVSKRSHTNYIQIAIKKGRYSLEQKRLLEQALNSDPNPSADKISSLAQQTGLAETQVSYYTTYIEYNTSTRDISLEYFSLIIIRNSI